MNKMIDIQTEDGSCDTYIACSSGEAKRPVVLLLMDAIGLRPRICDMADRFAEAGYFVLAPNAYYRTNRAPVVDYESLLNSENRGELFKHVMPMAAQLNPELSRRDTDAFLKFANEQSAADTTKVGVVGYCMGGGQALRAAGNFPSAIRAAASFHAGNLLTDAENSPHRWFPKIKAEVYLGHADNDTHMPVDQMKAVDEALRSAGVKYTSELYKGCAHGWTMADLPVYNPSGEAKHWEQVLALFERTLKS